jgi:hypothetical protein
MVYFGLLGLLGLFFFFQMKMIFFPQYRGKIVEIENIVDLSCDSCRGTRKGKTSIPIKVQTNEGKMLSCEISACTMCMEKIGVGSNIGVTKVGDRLIAQACANIRGKNT